MPELPTVAEAGLPGYEAAAWYGVLAPAGTPKTVIARLHRDITMTAQLPDVREQLSFQMIEPVVFPTPAAFAAFLDKEKSKWGTLVKKSGAKVD